VFEDFIGLSPEAAARWTALVEQCRPVLADEGMEAVQALLAEQGLSVIQAVAITRALLGWEETSLHAAIDLVDASRARSAARDAG
jgi:histidine ammonia-lyase